jgi:hypothetical protein
MKVINIASILGVINAQSGTFEVTMNG